MRLVNNRSRVKEKANAFINLIKNGVFIYGINKYSKVLRLFLEQRHIKINGFVDDFTFDNEIEGYPIFKINALKKEDFIINCIVDARPIDALRKIQSQGIYHYTDYYSLQALFNSDLLQIDYLAGTNAIWDNVDYEVLYNLLADGDSKYTLERVLNFRLNRDIEEMISFRFRIEEQYFEEFISLPEQPVFIDGGGFDGATTKKFIETYPNYKSIYYFEPTGSMLEMSIKVLANYSNIIYNQKGLWSKIAKLKFDNSNSSANKISFEGNSTIEVTSLDEIIQEKVDFIKLDIEGAEYEALLGAEQLIRNFKPKLAVCVYHKQIDFIRIPELILSFQPDYKVYLRHYTQGILETVMFFV
jgi:FkbM family methyltransferase